MSYVSGTRTLQSNSAEDLYAQASAALGAHGNWTFIEDFSTALYKWSVWRCGALNSTGVPFYVFFNRTIANSASLGIGIAEDYDSATHAFTRGAPTTTSGVKTPVADFSITGATTTVLYNAVGGTNMLVSTVAVDPSSYDYWFACNNDGFWLGCRVGAGSPQGTFVGTFDSLVDNPSVNDPRPIFMSGNVANGTSASQTVTTRHPFVTTALAYLWGLSECWGTAYTWPSNAIAGSVGSATGDLWQGAKAIGARIMARSWAFQRAASITTSGGNRGLYRHILHFAIAAGVTIGDTITIGSSTWVYTGKGNTFYESTAS